MHWRMVKPPAEKRGRQRFTVSGKGRPKRSALRVANARTQNLSHGNVMVARQGRGRPRWAYPTHPAWWPVIGQSPATHGPEARRHSLAGPERSVSLALAAPQTGVAFGGGKARIDLRFLRQGRGCITLILRITLSESFGSGSVPGGTCGFSCDTFLATGFCSPVPVAGSCGLYRSWMKDRDRARQGRSRNSAPRNMSRSAPAVVAIARLSPMPALPNGPVPHCARWPVPRRRWWWRRADILHPRIRSRLRPARRPTAHLPERLRRRGLPRRR